MAITIRQRIKNFFSSFSCEEESRRANDCYKNMLFYKGQVEQFQNQDEEVGLLNFIADELNNNYPKRQICYKGRVIRLKSSEVKPNIKVQDFLSVLPSMVSWCEEKGLTVKAFKKAYPDLPIGELYNVLQFEIFKESRFIKYRYDRDLYGVEEQWAPSLDVWYLREGDCENSSFILHGLFLAAGIPDDFYRQVGGMTYSGFGHQTLYAYDFKNSLWRHLEATYMFCPYDNFYKFPDNHDESWETNIKEVWWSFNSKYSWSVFKTDMAEKSYKNRNNEFKKVSVK